jgi:hypothetical protein
MGSGAKSYMRKGFLIYEEIRKFLPIEEAGSHNDFEPDPSKFLIYKKNFLFFVLYEVQVNMKCGILICLFSKLVKNL